MTYAVVRQLQLPKDYIEFFLLFNPVLVDFSFPTSEEDQSEAPLTSHVERTHASDHLRGVWSLRGHGGMRRGVRRHT